MQLLAAHQILIAAALALSAIFGARALVLFSRGGGSANLVAAAVSLILLGALLVYFRKLRARWNELHRAPPRR